jgi:hypothetical protein
VFLLIWCLFQLMRGLLWMGLKRQKWWKTSTNKFDLILRRRDRESMSSMLIKDGKWSSFSREILFGFILAEADFQASESSNWCRELMDHFGLSKGWMIMLTRLTFLVSTMFQLLLM